MKLTKSYIKEVIKEELDLMLEENNVNEAWWHAARSLGSQALGAIGRIPDRYKAAKQTASQVSVQADIKKHVQRIPFMLEKIMDSNFALLSRAEKAGFGGYTLLDKINQEISVLMNNLESKFGIAAPRASEDTEERTEPEVVTRPIPTRAEPEFDPEKTDKFYPEASGTFAPHRPDSEESAPAASPARAPAGGPAKRTNPSKDQRKLYKRLSAAVAAGRPLQPNSKKQFDDLVKTFDWENIR